MADSLHSEETEVEGILAGDQTAYGDVFQQAGDHLIHAFVDTINPESLEAFVLLERGGLGPRVEQGLNALYEKNYDGSDPTNGGLTLIPTPDDSPILSLSRTSRGPILLGVDGTQVLKGKATHDGFPTIIFPINDFTNVELGLGKGLRLKGEKGETLTSIGELLAEVVLGGDDIQGDDRIFTSITRNLKKLYDAGLFEVGGGGELPNITDIDSQAYEKMAFGLAVALRTSVAQ